LLACATAAALLFVASLGLARQECGRLTDAASDERSLRSALEARLQNELRLTLAQTVADEQNLRVQQNELSAGLLKSLNSVKRTRSRRAILASVLRIATAYQAASEALPAIPAKNLPSAVRSELDVINGAVQKQHGSVLQIELLTLAALVAALAGALLLILAGRTLWQQLRLEIAYCDQLRSEAVCKTNSLLSRMANAAVAVRDLSERLAHEPPRKQPVVIPAPVPSPGMDTVHALQTLAAARENLADIGRLTHDIRGISFKTNILALNASIEAAHAGDRGAGFGIVAGEMKSQAACVRLFADEVDSRLATLEAQLIEAAKELASAAPRKQLAVVVPISAEHMTLDPQIQDRLSAIAQDLEAFTGKPARKQPTRQARRKIK